MSKHRPKTLILLLLGIAFLGTATADELVYNVTGGVQNTNNHTFTFENQTSINQPQLYIVNPEGREETYQLQETGQKLQTEVPARLFDSKGVYKFNFQENSQSINPGNQSLVLGAANTTWKNRLTSLTENTSSGSQSCDTSSYTCFNEYYQGKSIASDLEAFRATENPEYLEKALNYSLSNWDNIDQTACSDFTCDDYGGDFATSSMRQGSVIEALWKVYSATGDQQVRQKAVNFTEGYPTGKYGCNVWENEFQCGNSTGHNSMMKGFWTAYKVTGNTSYKDIAVNLTAEAVNQSYNSSRTVSALTVAYQTTGNTTYRDRAYNYYQQNEKSCESGCDDWEELRNLKSGLQVHKVTGNNYFYRNPVNQVENLSVNCLTNTSANCTSTDQQADAAILSALLFAAKKDQEERFVNPVLKEFPSRDESLRIEPDMEGSVENPLMKVYDSQDVLEDSCSLNNINNSCSIDFSSFEQGVYTAELESANSTYPRQIPVTYSQRELAVENRLLNLTRSSPDAECDPWNSSFECVKDYETHQTFYMQGFRDLVDSYRNETYLGILGNLSSPPFTYLEVDNPPAKCLPEQDDYRCGTSAEAKAGELQGSLIESLYSSYQATGNISTLDLAYNYSSNSTSEGCRVWQDDFTCSNAEAQGLMIQGYWEAYEVTGNESYRNVSLELANHSDFSSSAPELSAAFWETYTWTNDTQHREKAENITSDLMNSTDCPNCSTENFLDYGNMLVSAYSTTANTTYRNALVNQKDNLTGICPDGSCSSSLLQGKAISFTARTMNTLPVTIDVETSMTVSPETLQVGDTADVKCSITNTMQQTSTGPIDISIFPGSIFEESEMNTTVSSLSYDQTGNYTENITASETGQQLVECRFSSPDFTVEETAQVTVEQEQVDNSTDNTDSTDSGDSGGDTGGGFIPVPDPEENTTEFTPRTANYNYTDGVYNQNQTGLPQEYRLTEFHTQSCFEASRTYYQNTTVLNASGCNSSQQLVLYDNNSEVELFRNFTGNFSHRFTVTENQTNWTKPEIYQKVQIPLTIQRETSKSVQTSSETQQVRFTLNSKTKCSLKHNGEVLQEYNARTVSAQVELEEGENNITLDCGDISKSMTATYDKPLTEEIAENAGKILAGVLLAGLAVLGLKFNTAVEIYHSKMFEHRFNNFRKALQNEEVVEAVEQYNKMSRHENTDAVQEKLLNSDVKMLTGLKMYLMSDMVSDPDIQLTADEKSSIQNSINNYITDNQGTKIARKIQENMSS